MKSFRLEGDIIPVSWYENIRKGKNKPDLEACLILANILYWYRPTEIRDETSERVVEYKQKFKGDKLQKSYQQYANFLGIPKSSIKRAIDNLVNLNLITREFRNFTTLDGLKLTNVMYLEPILDNILGISFKHTTSYRNSELPPQEILQDPPEEILQDLCEDLSDTNTEITTKDTTKIITKITTNKDILSSKELDLVAPIQYLNEKTGRNFSPTCKGTIRLIRARYNEGRTLEDFKRVIDKKCKDWLNDAKMKIYLRPSTLFNETNFENYINEPDEMNINNTIKNWRGFNNYINNSNK